jgi:hypothetical protein
MRLGRRLVLLTAVTLALGSPVAALAPAASAAATAPGASSQGFVRCVTLTPGTPEEVYLYPFGNPSHPIVLTHENYGRGQASDYMAVSSGQYTVAMRPAGSPASTPPSISTSFMISAGSNYTVASIGSATSRQLKVLQDQTASAAGSKVLVRVLQASLKESEVTASVGSAAIAQQLAFGSASGYQSVPAGPTTVTFSSAGGNVSMKVKLAAGSVHTLVAVDESSGLQIDNLTDEAGSRAAPQGGAATGMGGTAPKPGPGLAPWLGVAAAGVLLVGAGVFGLRRSRRPAAAGAAEETGMTAAAVRAGQHTRSATP